MPPYGYVIATTTAYRYRLEKSDLVKTANNKRQRLGQLSSHYGQSKISRYTCTVTLDTASRKLLANENVEGVYQYHRHHDVYDQYQAFYDEEGTMTVPMVYNF